MRTGSVQGKQTRINRIPQYTSFFQTTMMTTTTTISWGYLAGPGGDVTWRSAKVVSGWSLDAWWLMWVSMQFLGLIATAKPPVLGRVPWSFTNGENGWTCGTLAMKLGKTYRHVVITFPDIWWNMFLLWTKPPSNLESQILSTSLQVDDATKKAGYRLVRRTQRGKAVGQQGMMNQTDLDGSMSIFIFANIYMYFIEILMYMNFSVFQLIIFTKMPKV